MNLKGPTTQIKYQNLRRMRCRTGLWTGPGLRRFPAHSWLLNQVRTKNTFTFGDIIAYLTGKRQFTSKAAFNWKQFVSYHIIVHIIHFKLAYSVWMRNSFLFLVLQLNSWETKPELHILQLTRALSDGVIRNTLYQCSMLYFIQKGFCITISAWLL